MSYNSSERHQVHGIIVNLHNAVRADAVKGVEHWRQSLSAYVGDTDPVCKAVGELFELSGRWARNEADRRQALRPTILDLTDRIVLLLTDPDIHRRAP